MALMGTHNPVILFKGGVQKYGWGGYDYIPRIIGEENVSKEPYAELWMGVHPACPSMTGQGVLLSDAIKQNLRFSSGEGPALPYLCKVLDVRDMLSIQLHPDIEKAKEGFAEEERKGIPINAFERTYKDANHKPELMYALSDFYLLHGFREEKDLLNVLSERKSLKWAKDEIELHGLKDFYGRYMTMDQDEINRLLRPLQSELEGAGKEFDKSHPDYWALKALKTFCAPDTLDRGLLSIYLLNLVYLREGEVIFQGAGVPHAYLEGQNVEVMSNSDNVIRGGLTKKYIDNRALIELVDYNDRSIFRLKEKKEEEASVNIVRFEPPVKDFMLSVLEPDSGENSDYRRIRTKGISMLFSLRGIVELEVEKQKYNFSAGEAALLASNITIDIKSTSADRIFWVSSN